MSGIQAVLVGVIPSIGVALIFWYVMRAIIRADRREREMLAKADVEEAAVAAAEVAARPAAKDTSESPTGK